MKFESVILALSLHSISDPPSPTARDAMNEELNIVMLSDSIPAYIVPPFTANEFSKGIIGYAEVDEKNITNITFKLVDLNNNVICENYYEMS